MMCWQAAVDSSQPCLIGETFQFSLQCFVCEKRVYAMEFVAANQYIFHKWCFR